MAADVTRILTLIVVVVAGIVLVFNSCIPPHVTWVVRPCHMEYLSCHNKSEITEIWCLVFLFLR